MLYLIQGETLTNLANKIREKSDLASQLTPSEMAGAVDAVHAHGEEAGKKAEYDTFWDAYQEKGKRNNYSSAFFSYWWTDDIYNPKYDMVITTGASSMCQAARISNTKVKITLDGTSGNMFYGCSMLKTIPYLKLTEKATLPNAFRSCAALENITFDGVIKCDVDLQYSTKLTRASIESLMAHLWSCGYEYNEDLYTKCEWNGTTLVCSIVGRYGDPIELNEALITVYNANTGEEIGSNWSWDGSAVEFPYLDKNIVYAVVATDVFDTSGYEIGTATAAYSDGNSPWGSKTLTLSLEAVDTAFGDEIDVGSDTVKWHRLVLARPEWVISLV
jgi:hypothetical protein